MASAVWRPDRPEQLGRNFERLGRLGFWVQLVLLALTLAVGIWVLLMRLPDYETPPRLMLRHVVSLGSLVLLAFTTLWFRRYIALGIRIADEAARPAHASVNRTLWVGLWAGGLGVALSLALLLGAAMRMLFLMLANPQVGVLLAPNVGTDSLSAIDALGMVALILMLGAEILVLTLSLWLLFRCSRPARELAA